MPLSLSAFFAMEIIAEYSLPILAALLLIIFYLGLPDLQRCTLDRPGGHRLDRVDAAIMAGISLAYACVAFLNLGDTQAPESFVNMEQRSAIVELEESGTRELMLYSGVGIGDYTLEFSTDGENYSPLTSFSQTHGEVLKWNKVELEGGLPTGYLRISATGNVWLGELVARDGEGNIISASSNEAALTDEQELCPAEQTFMNSSYFDEIYHARTAWENLNGVYPYEITHPPLGKEIIALGITIFGMTPFGWRFSGTFLGVLMLPLMYVFLKKLFGGRTAPAAGTLVFAADFMHFVQTRIATIDTYAVFFILLMYLFMYLFFTENKLRYLALSGLFFGLGAASKWTCLYAGAGLALIWAWYWIKNARRGIRAFLKNCGFCLVFFVLLPCTIYYLSYIPYAQARGGLPLFSMDYLKMVLDNQEYMFNYHSTIEATHPYSSRWYQWIFDIRPILYYLQYLPEGMRSSFGAFVNPALCWGGFIGLFALGYLAIGRRDQKAAFILLGYLAQLLPWVFVSRLTFEYHYFPCTVFLVLTMGYIFRLMELNCRRGKTYAWSFAFGCLALFALFYPALSGAPVDNAAATKLLGWLPSWPF